MLLDIWDFFLYYFKLWFHKDGVPVVEIRDSSNFCLFLAIVWYYLREVLWILQINNIQCMVLSQQGEQFAFRQKVN